MAAQQGWHEDLCVLLKALLVPRPWRFPGGGCEQDQLCTMGNEISHRRYWCRRFRRFERLPAEERTDVSDVPTAQPAQGGRSWSSGSPPENEKLQGAAAGLYRKEKGRKKEMASCSPPVAQGMRRSSELLQIGEAGDNPPATNPAGKTQGRAAGAEAAGGHPEVTTRGSPLQPAVTVGAGEVQSKQGTVRSSSGSQQRASTRVSRARQCKLCRWLQHLKTSREKPKAKAGAVSSQE